jgi:hypothetical protein
MVWPIMCEGAAFWSIYLMDEESHSQRKASVQKFYIQHLRGNVKESALWSLGPEWHRQYVEANPLALREAKTSTPLCQIDLLP